MNTRGRLIDALLPAVCIHCENRLGPEDEAVCTACRDRLAACRRDRVRTVTIRATHGQEDAPAPMNVFSLWVYATGSPVRSLHRALKYGGRRDVGLMAGREMGRLARRRLPFVDRTSLVLPVPSHPIRIAERGYNHAELLARSLSAELRLECRPTGLRRVRLSASQTSVRRDAREGNVRGAFDAPDPGFWYGRPVIIVDDVFTTGATLRETASAVRRAGATFLTAVTMAIRIVR